MTRDCGGVKCTGLSIHSEHNAKVEWRPNGDNRAPILGHTIQYNTSFTPDTWVDASEASATVTSIDVGLSPWANYTFRVISKNRVGPSLPSGHSEMCTTPKDRPLKNPQNVEGRGTEPDNLVIRWTVRTRPGRRSHHRRLSATGWMAGGTENG